MILDKLYKRFNEYPIKIWDIKSNLIVAQRVPKDKTRLIISDLIECGYLIKTGDAEYRLRDGICKDIEAANKKHSIVRNKIFLE